MAKAKKHSGFSFLGETIPPSSRRVIELEAAKLYTDSPLSIPIEVLHGASPGPVLMINAAIHGDELNGVEIIRQLLNTLDEKKLKGTVIAVPIVNVFGFIHKSRCFPGSEKGSLASRMAHTFFSQVAERCDYILDLHTGAIHRTNLPQIRADLSNSETLRIAQAFATPVIIDSPLRDGSLRSEAEKQQIPVLTYEAGEALRFDPIAINAGIIGIKRVMQSIGMLRPSRKKIPNSIIAKSTSWLRAEADGILRTLVSLGDKVEKGQVLAYINSPLGKLEVEIRANKSGIVIGQQTLPLVNEGDAVFHLAYFHKADDLIEQVVEEFIEELTEADLEPLTTGHLVTL
ncbi:N-alpha-acetyl-L-2,C4-diaminobutyric acid deacetylase [Vibrio cholerae]|nr:N-alpha-acetyl-L-2,C4-diaminobutyric acid deacetylase [Vibrio cholerae]GFK36389.1 N-alpha-acetyl-L-2,C4-diaminobutyric acid deacetylase [Vibrio cholerae]GFK39966.1 N-alpha-acetyl-L-2,C4-diaminobutyric acid deacetylase [Vibrio cholerae]GFK43477.1 N-alpha-acetyl-L-2,C4-diaminobutyric acid deacetylase [Vibrio cholerae]GFK47060.1 N-alpha-acetyl-L-2,C4-diaminobutyric acid deacetylase [Vibrio cholerae]